MFKRMQGARFIMNRYWIVTCHKPLGLVQFKAKNLTFWHRMKFRMSTYVTTVKEVSKKEYDEHTCL
jgi:hypothetical protein